MVAEPCATEGQVKILMFIFLLLGILPADARNVPCILDPPPKVGYAYTGLPNSVHLDPNPDCHSGQEHGGKVLHVMMSDDLTEYSDQNLRGYLCQSIRSALFYNIKPKLFNKSGARRVDGYFMPPCRSDLKSTKPHFSRMATICKPLFWLDLVEDEGIGEEDYILIRDATDTIHGTGIDQIISRFEHSKAEVLMGVQGSCALPIFNAISPITNRSTPRPDLCERFWRKMGSQAVHGSYINSGLLMGKRKHLRRWLKYIISVLEKTKVHDWYGDQSIFGLGFVREKMGDTSEGPLSGLKVDLDGRNISFVVADCSINSRKSHLMGWSLSRNRNWSGGDGEGPFDITNPLVDDPPRPVILHFAGQNIFGKKGMLCSTHLNPSEGACFPKNTKICQDGQPVNLGDICPTEWTRGCSHTPSRGFYPDDMLYRGDIPPPLTTKIAKEDYAKKKPPFGRVTRTGKTSTYSTSRIGSPASSNAFQSERRRMAWGREHRLERSAESVTGSTALPEAGKYMPRQKLEHRAWEHRSGAAGGFRGLGSWSHTMRQKRKLYQSSKSDDKIGPRNRQNDEK